MGIWDDITGYYSKQIGGSIDYLGGLAGDSVKDWGVSEGLQGLRFPKVSEASADYSPTNNPYVPSNVGATTGSQSAPPTGQVLGRATGPTATPGPTGDTGGGNGQSSGPSGYSTEDVEAHLSEQYNPVFALLDKRLGLLPGKEEKLKGQVSSLETYQRGEAERGKEAQEAQLGESRVQEETKSTRTLDEFSTDLANLLRKVGGIYGGSSGAEAVGAAIGKQGTRSRGELFQARDTALRNIQGKVEDVNREYEGQMGKIDQWKSDQLMEVSGYITNLRDEIEGQKANASSQKASQLSQMMMDAYVNAQSYLQNLDAMVKKNKMDMDSWREQRAGELEDYMARLKASSQYSGSDYGTPEAGTVAMGTQDYQPGGGVSTIGPQYGKDKYDESPWASGGMDT